jgi:hypothetical protein
VLVIKPISSHLAGIGDCTIVEEVKFNFIGGSLTAIDVATMTSITLLVEIVKLSPRRILMTTESLWFVKNYEIVLLGLNSK